MLYLNHRYISIKTIGLYLFIILVCSTLISCGEPPSISQQVNTDVLDKVALRSKLSEVAPPPVIQELRKTLEPYQPEVKILSPIADEIIEDTTVNVKLEVKDLPIFKDKILNLGPNIQLILDNQTAQTIYNVDEPLILENLSPGSHTIRVFAARPWFESFKNEGAYAQTTFHIYTKTPEDIPDPNKPVLTYSPPQQAYGSEPIMLDFYLANAPLHFVAQEDPEDSISDWRIRVTINGQTFLLDNWQPIYLKGFEPGKNWAKLEYIDEQGKTINNVFNTTVKLINYNPNSSDPLTNLITNKIGLPEAEAIVNPNYRTTVSGTKETSTTEETTPLLPNPSPQETEITPTEESTPSSDTKTQTPVLLPLPPAPENPEATSIQIPGLSTSEVNPETTSIEIPVPSTSEVNPETTSIEIPVPSISEVNPETTSIEIPVPSISEVNPDNTSIEIPVPSISEVNPDNTTIEIPVPSPSTINPENTIVEIPLSTPSETNSENKGPLAISESEKNVTLKEDSKKLLPKEGLLNFWRRNRNISVAPEANQETSKVTNPDSPVEIPAETSDKKGFFDRLSLPKIIPLTPPSAIQEIKPAVEEIPTPQLEPVLVLKDKADTEVIIPQAKITEQTTPTAPPVVIAPSPETPLPNSSEDKIAEQTTPPAPPVAIAPTPETPLVNSTEEPQTPKLSVEKPKLSVCLKTRESFIAPGTLVGLAYQGLFQSQDIPKGDNLSEAYILKTLKAKNIVEAAIADCLLDRKYDLENNQGYLDEINKELELLSNP